MQNINGDVNAMHRLFVGCKCHRLRVPADKLVSGVLDFLAWILFFCALADMIQCHASCFCG
jgi:hypothetical protein